MLTLNLRDVFTLEAFKVMSRLFTFIILLAGLVVLADGARILAVFPFQARSHYKVYEPLLLRLAEKGHDVHTITHFPQKIKRANFTDIDVSSTLPNLVSSLSMEDIKDFTVWKNVRYLLHYGGWGICEPVLGYPPVKDLLKSSKKFDLLIVEIFATECFLGMAHTLKIPRVVGAITSVALPWSNQILRNPENPSYIPNWFSSYTDNMSFRQRLLNTLGLPLMKFSFKFLSDWPSHEIARNHLGDDLPSFDELRSRMSLILTNGHISVSSPRPLAPGLKEIGGIHIPISGPPALDKDLRDYLDNADGAGVVYFSLGSQIDPATLPAQVQDIFYKAFSQLPQQVLWKCSAEKMPNLPSNVKCIEWAPQLSILCHPKIRLFITHGGLLGAQEAIYCAVPILGLPLFGDQYLNMAYFEGKGMALQLDIRRLSYQPLFNSLNQILTNKSYAEMAREQSLRFRDRPIPPLEEAVYWVEYVLRYGPKALKTFATELTWYQYYLLDVVITLTFVTTCITLLLYKFFTFLLRPAKPLTDVDRKTK